MRSAALLLAVAPVLPAVAQNAGVQSRAGEVEVLIERAWPEQLGKGWFPIFVDLENRGGDGEEVRLTVSSSSMGPLAAGREVTRTVQLAPGERRSVELLVPVIGGLDHGGFGTGFSVEAAVGENRVRLSAGGEAWAPEHFPLVLFSEEFPDAADLAVLERDLERRSPRAIDGEGFSQVPSGLDVHVAGAPFDRLPREWAAYSSLQVVALDLTRGVPEARTVEPLLQWVRLGGILVLVGDPRALLERVTSLEGTFEERFRLGEWGGVTAHAHGLGRVYRVDGVGATDDPEAVRALEDAVLSSNDADERASRGYVPSPGPWRLGGSRLLIPGLGELPLRAFMVLLFLFAVVIGPVNLLVLKRLGRPALLLVTIPVLSAGASVGLLLYGVLHQGIDTKAARRSLTWLDQRQARAAVVERRRVFVGMSRGGGLVPGAGTAVFPEHAAPDDRFLVREDGGRRLAGSFLPVRDAVDHVVLTETSARAHLEVRRVADGLEVVNAFDTTVRSALLRDPEGEWYRLEGGLEPGETGLARPSEDEGRAFLEGWTRSPLTSGLELRPACYAARLTDGPFTDDCGLDLNVRDERHLLLGVLDAEGEAWR